MAASKNTYSDSDLESVISFKHPSRPRRNSTGPKYFCSIEGCEQSFKRLDHLDRHEFHHTGIKKHHCLYEGCDKVYSILTHLKRHVRITHERVGLPVKNVTCQIPGCLKMFQTETNMYRHIREVHENPKIYPCGFCSEKFTQKLKLRRHEIQKHTADYPYTCGKCSRGFYQQWQYDKHVPVCKVYFCANCDSQFDKWTLYVKHCKDKQHGRKYYQCEHCDRIYGKPNELQNHIAAKHMQEEQKMIFACKTCERKYTYERNLKHHMRVAHGGKRFDCSSEGCERVFSSLQNLAKHLEREHHATTDKSIIPHKYKELKGSRKKRKDAGQSVISNLAKLSGIAVDKNFDKLLRGREEDALNVAGNVLLQQQSESEDDIPLAKLARTHQAIDTNTSVGLETLLSAVLADV